MGNHPTTAAASLLQALHARFEANNAEYNVIEAARPADHDLAERGKIDRATSANEYEADALRFAILTQVPDSHPDALVLMFHIRLEQDAQAHSAVPPSNREKSILATAIDTLFDFHACESESDDFDYGKLGKQLRTACRDVYDARRYRTGVVEG
ncbi:hypothetical protein GCM10008023_19780 [Sphingomonas glacialis]|uniref:Uncharacterized protein n=1 Tax=Sphingomonas glacialis TaxID=658225 RepID=A0ABQ3LH62_9SPHN|nr:hypothetical protein [Sphingomonas glacialis]GHH16128.1 hypothetical protein GCM10008023_19780 [Sphingomonas glacialis]